MKTKSLIKKFGILFLVLLLIQSLHLLHGQNPIKKGTPLSKDLVIDIQPVVAPNLPESSGATYYPTVLPGEPGDAYLDVNWNSGLVIMKDQSEIELPQMRYNILTQQIQFVRDTEIQAISNPQEVSLIRINDKVFIYDEFITDGVRRSGYLELLEDGSCKLLRRWIASYKQVDELTGEETIYRTQRYFLQFDGGEIGEVKTSSAAFCETFGKHGNELKKFMKEQKLKVRNPQHLRSLVSYYNMIATK
jgi:hypothetical protein